MDQLKKRLFENMVGVAMCNVPGEKYGHSVTFDGISFMATEEKRDMFLIEAGEVEGIIYMARFDIDGLKKYHQMEVWRNAFRKPDSTNNY